MVRRFRKEAAFSYRVVAIGRVVLRRRSLIADSTTSRLRRIMNAILSAGMPSSISRLSCSSMCSGILFMIYYTTFEDESHGALGVLSGVL